MFSRIFKGIHVELSAILLSFMIFDGRLKDDYENDSILKGLKSYLTSQILKFEQIIAAAKISIACRNETMKISSATSLIRILCIEAQKITETFEGMTICV